MIAHAVSMRPELLQAEGQPMRLDRDARWKQAIQHVAPELFEAICQQFERIG